MNTKEKIAVMQAFVDGKAIQVANKNCNDWSALSTKYEPAWSWDELDYRIKPEPKVRPYTFEEMKEAVRKHGLTVESKYSGAVLTITLFKHDYIWFGDCPETYVSFLTGFIWLDGSPCGVVEE